MKALNTICLYLIIAVAIVGSFIIDTFENATEKYFKDDAVASILTVVAILATALTIFGICWHFDIASILRDYYWELCRKLTWP